MIKSGSIFIDERFLDLPCFEGFDEGNDMVHCLVEIEEVEREMVDVGPCMVQVAELGGNEELLMAHWEKDLGDGNVKVVDVILEGKEKIDFERYVFSQDVEWIDDEMPF